MGESYYRNIVIICLTILTLTATTLSKPSRVVTRLIHRDSVDSPYYNPNATALELAARARDTSASRLAYLSSRIAPADITPSDHRARINADTTGVMFMAKISIGDPPYPQFFIIDTASSLLWLQCKPCIHCFPQSLYLFDPSKSKSYAPLSCYSPLCTLLPPADRCDANRACRFAINYMDDSGAKGVMATEKLTFSRTDTVNDVIMGCGYDNAGFFGPQACGILGLGPDAVSLVTHLGSEFSYCIGSIRNPSYAPNFLVLGYGSNYVGDETKLEVADGMYYLTVTGMSIDTRAMDIDPAAFRRSESTGRGGVIIDSGTTITYLASAAYKAVEREVVGLLEGVVERVAEEKRVCYKGLMERDLVGFPVVTFHFEGGAELGMEAESLFIVYRVGEFCLAVEEALTEDGASVIGVMAQQRYNVAYDLVDMKISFQRADCDVYEKMVVDNSN